MDHKKYILFEGEGLYKIKNLTQKSRLTVTAIKQIRSSFVLFARNNSKK